MNFFATFFPLLLTLPSSVLGLPPHSSTSYSAALQTGATTAITESSPLVAFDGPKLSPVVNSSSYDWWYFDAIATDGSNTSVSLTFYTAPVTAFPVLGPIPGNLAVQFVFSFSNGSSFGFIVPATEAVITTLGDGSSGLFTGTGYESSWVGSPDLSYYEISLASETIQGTLILASVCLPIETLPHFIIISLLTGAL